MDVRAVVIHSLLAIVGLLGGFGFASLAVKDASAAGTAYVYTGYLNKCETWQYDNWNPSGLAVNQGHYCWHFDELSPNQWNGSIDQHSSSGTGDGNQAVWWIQGGVSYGNVVIVRFDVIPPGGCTGVRTVVTNGLAGAFSYLHINETTGLSGTTWQNWSEWPGWVQGDRYLGTTAPEQSNCLWTGPHLHQGGNVDWWTDIWRQQPSHVSCGGILYCWSGPAFTVSW
jgi:hypothetical protein